MAHFIYILSNPDRTRLSINKTADLDLAIAHHKSDVSANQRRKLIHVIYMELAANFDAADYRMQQLRHARRKRKWNLIMASNPKLNELCSIVSDASESV